MSTGCRRVPALPRLNSSCGCVWRAGHKALAEYCRTASGILFFVDAADQTRLPQAAELLQVRATCPTTTAPRVCVCVCLCLCLRVSVCLPVSACVCVCVCLCVYVPLNTA